MFFYLQLVGSMDAETEGMEGQLYYCIDADSRERKRSEVGTHTSLFQCNFWRTALSLLHLSQLLGLDSLATLVNSRSRMTSPDTRNDEDFQLG